MHRLAEGGGGPQTPTRESIGAGGTYEGGGMTDTPTVYTAHDVPDLINSLPTLFGFAPSESLIGIATSGPRRRFGFRLRVDIPDPHDIDELAGLVAGHLFTRGPRARS